MEDGDEEQIDAWGDLGARYRYDSRAQFVLFVEQLAVTRELLTAHEVSKQRMALLAVDNLAELVLHRHKRRLVDAAQESWRDVEPRLSSNDEQRLHRSFDARVDFGLKGCWPRAARAPLHACPRQSRRCAVPRGSSLVDSLEHCLVA